MDAAPTHSVIVRAEGLKLAGHQLTAEAEILWTEVQELVQDKASVEKVQEKVARLKEIRAEMTTTATDFVALMNKHPQLVSWLEGTPAPQWAPPDNPAGVSAPKPMPNSRKSRMSAVPFQVCGDASYTALGGREVTVRTSSDLLGELECIVLEPRGKALAPQDYVTTGVVICLQGMPPSKESLKEWCEATKSAGWLQHGATVVIPNIQAASALAASDIAAVIEAILDYVAFDRVLLIGKDLMALRILETAAEELLEDSDKELCGIILVGPCSPVPHALQEVSVPLMLLWAEDDEISSFDDRQEWLEAMENTEALATVKMCQKGGHSLAGIMDQGGAAQIVANYFLTVFLMADLLGDDEASQAGSNTKSKEKTDARVENLLTALPKSVKEACTSGVDTATSDTVTQHRRMTANLVTWMQAGMSDRCE